MSRQLSRSSAAQAACAALLVIGVLLLLIVSGRNGDAADQERSAGSGESGAAPVQELAGGFTTIPADDFFATVTAAQKAAGSWRVVSVAETGDQTSPPSVQDVANADAEPRIRISVQSARGPLTGVYVEGQFYVSGLTGAGKPWWKVPTSPQIDDLLVFADPERFLAGLRDPESFEVIGVERTDAGNAVHYKIGLQAATYDDQGAEAGSQPVTMEMWVDKQNRPVQVVTESTVEGQAQTSTLVYSNYGRPLDIAAPPPDEVTTRAPANVAR